MSFLRLTSVGVALAALACGGGGGEAGPVPDGRCPSPALRISAQLAGVRDNARPGTVSAVITDDFPRTIAGPASGFSRTVFPALMVVDGFTTDAVGRPAGELVVFSPGTPVVGTRPLVPVTLQQIRDPQFRPDGPFALWAESFDASRGDYTRWLIADAGTLGIDSVRNEDVGRVGLTVSFTGTWRDASGTQIGCGRIAGATIDAPLVRTASATSALADTLEARLTGSLEGTVGTKTIDAFQTLGPNDTRLVLVATIAGNDTTRELWLSLKGARLTTDSVPLGELSLDGARAGRDTGSFAMLRVLTLSQTTPVVVQVWRSTSGWVKLTNLVPGAPLITCGWGTARFAFAATGHDNATGAVVGTLDAAGAVESLYTVLSPADSLVDLRTARVALRPSAPESARGRRCFL